MPCFLSMPFVWTVKTFVLPGPTVQALWTWPGWRAFLPNRGQSCVCVAVGAQRVQRLTPGPKQVDACISLRAVGS